MNNYDLLCITHSPSLLFDDDKNKNIVDWTNAQRLTANVYNVAVCVLSIYKKNNEKQILSKVTVKRTKKFYFDFSTWSQSIMRVTYSKT
jgi:hypothetical protein